MCAIAGILGLRYSEFVIQSMLKTMARRGPDGNGVAMSSEYCLLHSRLAIIDPEGGQQPMKLQHNGRSYIFADLPGTYSISARSAEEEAARDFICFGNPDAVAVLVGERLFI